MADTFKTMETLVDEVQESRPARQSWEVRWQKKEEAMSAFLADNPELKAGRYILKCESCGTIEKDEEVDDYYEATYNWGSQTASYGIKAKYVYGSSEFDMVVTDDEPKKKYICSKCVKDGRSKSFKDTLEKVNGLSFKEVREISKHLIAPPAFENAVFDSKTSLGDLHSVIEKQGLYFYGGVGSGKTARIYGLLFVFRLYKDAMEVQHEDFKASMYDMATFMRSIRNFDKLDSFIYDTSKVPILILDDFGAENGSDYEMASLYEVINYRWQYKKVTVFTSNLPLKDWMERNGDNGTRIGSRIASMAKQIKIDGSDKRVN